MSLKLILRAFMSKTGNPYSKLLLIKLADNANDEGECWPSHSYLAEYCEISVRSVINYTKKLEQLGLINIINRFKGNKKISNYYVIFPECSDLDVHSVHEGGAQRAHTSSAQRAHRTCNSLEPVIEPKKGKKHFDMKDMEFSSWARDQIVIRQPNFKEPNLKTWAKEVSLMVRLDGREFDHMQKLWVWAINDGFWRTVIQSMSKFRKHYNALTMKVEGEINGQNWKPNGSAGERTRQQCQEIFAEASAIEAGISSMAEDEPVIPR